MTTPSSARSRILVLGVAVVFIAIVSAMLLGRGQPPAQQLHGATVTDSAAGQRNQLEAGRSRAREALTSGRIDQAFEFYRNLDERDLEAEDCFRLESSLLEQKRIVLGWAALEAARRIDRSHRAASQALDTLLTRQALAADRERSLFKEAADKVELLLTVPGGPPLGTLILGLARYSGDLDQERQFLDRLMARDRGALRGLNSRASVFKLIARLLLEMGRAEDARALLQNMVDAAAPAPAPDREAAWLLSRAALQLDQKDVADSMLALAGDFGKSATSSPEPSPFVGSKRCRECHLRIYGEEQAAGAHARTLRFGPDLKTVPLPAQPVADPVFPRVTHHFSRKGDDRIELETRIDDRTIHAIVEYALGSGHHGITMVARDDAGIDRELRISYFAQTQTWVKTKGVDMAPQEPGDHIGPALSHSALDRCVNCHKTSFRPVDLTGQGRQWPEASDHGIGCERCHGPGLNHVKSVETGFAELAIAQTTTTPVRARLNSCTECHASDGSVAVSDPEFTRAQGTTLLFSKCFTASKGGIGCTTCHDPHRLLDRSIPQYEAICLSCHRASSPRRDGEPPQAIGIPGESASAGSCPVSPAVNCISCHMPKVEDLSRQARFTDHHIRVHRPPGLAQAVDGGK